MEWWATHNVESVESSRLQFMALGSSPMPDALDKRIGTEKEKKTGEMDDGQRSRNKDCEWQDPYVGRVADRGEGRWPWQAGVSPGCPA